MPFLSKKRSLLAGVSSVTFHMTDQAVSITWEKDLEQILNLQCTKRQDEVYLIAKFDFEFVLDYS